MERGRAERNMGIELLRVVSMYMIVILHLVGAILPAENDHTNVYEYLWLMEAGAFCAVNCYAMISGYVGAGAKASLGRAVNLWLEVAFYTVGLTALFSVTRPELLGEEAWLNALMPVTRGQYWYISAYFGLMVMMPLLDIAAKNASPAVLGSFALGTLLIYSCLPFGEGANPYFVLSNGYSLVWLIILYLFGAYLNKSDLIRRVRPWQALLVFVLAVAATWMMKMGGEGKAYAYPFPTILLSGAALTVFFSKLRIREGRLQKVISLLAAGSLGVYLIHINSLFYRAVTDKLPKSFPSYGGIKCVLLTLGTAVALFLSCEAVDLVRRGLFRLTRLDRLGAALDRALVRARSRLRGKPYRMTHN